MGETVVMVVGASVIDRVMGAALLREQDCPLAYFTSVDCARQWLSRLPVLDALEASAAI
ncbi:hypothetical protein WMO79_20130 [Micrococcaceae bacterium Sec7.4]